MHGEVGPACLPAMVIVLVWAACLPHGRVFSFVADGVAVPGGSIQDPYQGALTAVVHQQWLWDEIDSLSGSAWSGRRGLEGDCEALRFFLVRICSFASYHRSA